MATTGPILNLQVDKLQQERRRTGLWLIGSGLYGLVLTVVCLALLVTR